MAKQCKSILVVEDDADIRDLVESVLRMEGYTVHAAPNGREAIHALARAEQPCLILLDLMMPVMDGWEFLKQQSAKVVESGSSVVIVSALNASNALGHDDVSPAVGYLKKPMGLNTLMDVIRQYCGAPDAAASDASSDEAADNSDPSISATA